MTTKFPIGDETSHTVVIAVTPVVAANAHTDADVLGGLMTFADAARGNFGGGVIKSVVITTESALATADLDMYFFSANPSSSTVADDGALTVHDDDLDKLLGHLFLDQSAIKKDMGDADVLSQFGLNIPFTITSDSPDLYAVMVLSGAGHTPAVGDLIVKLGIAQD